MINLIKSKLDAFKNEKDKFNYLREFLQVTILSIMDEAGYFRNLAFIGGTALRIIYKVNRYSEDLDFSLINKDAYDFELLLAKLLRELDLRGLAVDVKKKRNKPTVQSVFFRFANVLHEVGLSPLKDEKLFIKFEIDTNPPLGYRTEFHTLKDPMLFNVLSFDKASLMAGKLHAILERRYEKGRDYYDLLWYLLENVEPNLELLNNALKQTAIQDYGLTASSWKSVLLEKLRLVDFDKVAKDVGSFLIYEHELKSINLQNFERILMK